MTHKEKIKPMFNKQLSLLFIVSLIFFSIFRWDIESWVQRKLDFAIAQNHLDITYDTLDLHPTSLELSNVYLRLLDMPKPLLLGDVYLQLDWSALWKMRLAVSVKIKNSFIQMSTSISSHSTSIMLTSLTGQLDVRAAQAWYGQTSLAQAAGNVYWQGNIKINSSTGRPIQTDLQISWQDATLNMMQQSYILGNYVLNLKQTEQNQVWTLQGGEQLQTKGSGTLQINRNPPFMWKLQGNIDVKTSENTPLAAILPKTKGKVKITGTLGQPQWTLMTQ